MFNFHLTFSILLFGIALSLVGTFLSFSLINLIVCMSVGAIFGSCMTVMVNVAILNEFKGKQENYWIQLTHSFWTIGGFAMPFLFFFIH